MNKALTVSIYTLLAFSVLFPAGELLDDYCAFNFEPASIDVLIILSIITVCFIIFAKSFPQSKVLQIMISIFAPLSMIDGFCFLSYKPSFWVSFCVLAFAVFCCFLTLIYSKLKKVKVTAMIISGILFVPLVLISFISPLFGNIGKETVTQSLESPDGKYSAEVIDDDQGALGGNTYVFVYDNDSFDLDMIFFKIMKKPILVYRGNWGEFMDMKIDWKDNGCLKINSAEYLLY
jgi:hypothetical protein